MNSNAFQAKLALIPLATTVGLQYYVDLVVGNLIPQNTIQQARLMLQAVSNRLTALSETPANFRNTEELRRQISSIINQQLQGRLN